MCLWGHRDDLFPQNPTFSGRKLLTQGWGIYIVLFMVIQSRMTTKGKTMRLTEDQKEIMLRLCDAAETSHSVMLMATNKIRETSTGCALVRKGLAIRNPDGRFEATDEGWWLGDSLRIEKRIKESEIRAKSYDALKDKMLDNIRISNEKKGQDHGINS